MRHEHVEELRREGYALVRELGRGGFATVYLAEHVRLHRLVAVKVLTVDVSDPAAHRRFERECESMGKLSEHPYVVDVLDARVSPGGLPFIAMRLYQGGSLGHHLQRYGPLDPVQALNVGRRAAEALAAGHSIGIIHRDVKPENFLLDERREPYLADFGIAVLLHPELTATTSVAFTRQHAAPEVLLDNAYGPLSDVYSLASTLHEILSGQPPFVADTDGRQMMMVLREPAPIIRRSDLPLGLQEAILRGLEKDPARRWASMSSFSDALREISYGVPPMPVAPLAPTAPGPSDGSATRIADPVVPTATPVPVGATGEARPRRRRAAIVGAAALVLALGSGAAAGLLNVLDRETGAAASSAPASPTTQAAQSPMEPTAAVEESTSTPSRPNPGSATETGEVTDPGEKIGANGVSTPSGPVEGGTAVEADPATLVERYSVGDCLDDGLGVVDCSLPHRLQVTGFATADRPCITAGEDFVGRGATFTSRVVHDRIRGPEVDPSLTGSMCLTGLVDRDRLQTIGFSLEAVVGDNLTSARLVGGCQSENRVSGLGDASDLGPCSVDRPWLSGHSWRKGPIPADPPYCRTFSRAMDGRPYIAEPFEQPFDTAALWAREVERSEDLQAGDLPSFFVPRIEVELRPGEAETFEAATAQAMPIPRPEDHPTHYRLVCGVRAY